MSSLTTAKALPPGEGQVAVGGGYYTSPDINEALNKATSGTSAELKLPYTEVMYRRGLIQNFEMGLKATIPGTVALDAKYQLVGIGGFNAAVGLGAGWLSIESSASAGSSSAKSKNTVIDLFVPVYSSYDMEFMSVYTVPKYNLRYISSSGTSSSGGQSVSASNSGTAHMAGATAGVKLGSTWGVYIESTYMKGLGTDFNLLQFNSAFYW